MRFLTGNWVASALLACNTWSSFATTKAATTSTTTASTNNDREPRSLRDRSRGDGSQGGAGAFLDRDFADPVDHRTVPPIPEAVVGRQPGCESVNLEGFDICLDLQSDTAPGQYQDWMAEFPPATAAWEQVIVGDLLFDCGVPYLPSSNLDLIVESQCSTYPTDLDDLYICAKDEIMDGESGVLGYAYISVSIRDRLTARGPVVQPVVGEMRYDAADIEKLMKRRTFGDVVKHEIGHILGVGLLWPNNGLLNGDFYSDQVGLYQTKASEEWRALGCTGSLPVETDFGGGTRFGHWDEDCLQDEVMTGFAEGRPMPFSRITIATMQDMGFVVDYSQADPFTRQDLGECCQYCSGGTKPCPGHLNRRDLLDEKEEDTSRRKPRRLSDAGQAAVFEFARAKLTELRSHGAVNRGMNPLLEGSASGNLQYVGGDLIHVMYQEADTMFGMGVTWEMVR